MLCFWWPFLDRRWDWAFLGLVAGLLLAPTLYPDIDRLKIPTLGRLVWFRLGVASVLAFRNHKRLNFGFWPTPAEWAVGVRTALLFLPIAGVLNLVLQFAHFRIVPDIWWKAPGTFLGFLWIMGLAEEVFGRGMLLELVRVRGSHCRRGFKLAIRGCTFVAPAIPGLQFVHCSDRGRCILCSCLPSGWRRSGVSSNPRTDRDGLENAPKRMKPQKR